MSKRTLRCVVAIKLMTTTASRSGNNPSGKNHTKRSAGYLPDTFSAISINAAPKISSPKVAPNPQNINPLSHAFIINSLRLVNSSSTSSRRQIAPSRSQTGQTRSNKSDHRPSVTTFPLRTDSSSASQISNAVKPSRAVTTTGALLLWTH